jgi:hypothetical protein
MNQALRSLVEERARFRCEYCRLPVGSSLMPFECDHIIAEKHEGPTVADNLAFACFYCNRFKGPNLSGFDKESNTIIRLFNPRQDVWEGHFCWAGVRLIGKTPIGRVTVAVLGINLPGNLRLRETLIEEGFSF